MPATNNTIWLLDFDRCLGNVASLYNRLSMCAESFGVSQRQINEARRELERSGGSFDALAYLKTQLSMTDFDELLVRYKKGSTEGPDEAYLESGALEFLKWLRQTKQSHMIVTYGGETWQTAKLQRAGLAHFPYMIIGSPQKGKLVASWFKTDTKAFIVPKSAAIKNDIVSGVYDSLQLVDDKLVAFDYLPEHASGYLVSKDSVNQILPMNVRQISSLKELVGRKEI